MKDIDAIRVKAANAVTALADLNATLAASYQSDVHVLRETAELQSKELGLLRHRTEEQSKELDVLREANHSLARNCAEESNRASALQTELNSVSSKLKIAAEYERELKQLIVDIRREAGEAKEQLAEAETKNRELSAEFAKASEALAKYDEQSEFHNWTNGDFAKQIAAVREERDRAGRCLQKASDDNRFLMSKIALAQVEAEVNKKAFEEADEEQGKLKQALQDVATERDALREANEALEKSLRAYEARIVSLERDCDALKDANEAAKKQIDRYEGEIDSLNRSFDASRQKRHADHAHALKLIEQQTKRADENSELFGKTKDELDACKKELVKREAEMRATNDSQGEHIARLMKELSQVKEEFVRKAFVEGNKHDEELAKTKDELDACKKESTRLRTDISRLERELREEKAAHERAVNDALDISRMIRV